MKSKVEIVPYRDTWPEEFQTLATSLRKGLGKLALRIDHIGSTAVPGLAAKDVIDIQVTVAELNQALIEVMKKFDYRLSGEISRDHRPSLAEGPDSDWEKWYFEEPERQRR